MQEQDMNATGMNEPGARESTPVFIKSEDLEIRESKKDYSSAYELPSIRTRLFSIMIDGVFIIVLLYGFTLLFDTIGSVPDYFKKITFLFCFVLYEPLFISIGSTLGQSLMEIQVRSFSNPEKRINIFQAFLRFFVKIFLG